MTEHSKFTFNEHALHLLNDPNTPLFLTGKAGTGKSTIIRHWRTQHPKWNILTLAPTGIAALNVNGMTIHRFMHVKAGVTPVEAIQAARRQDSNFYHMLDAIVIDEVSMVRADLMDCLNQFLQTVRNNDTPFGGVKIVFTGDLAQLPPVVDRNETKAFKPDSQWDGPWFFQSHAIQQMLTEHMLKFAELTDVHRQTDPVFIDCLNRLREGDTSQLHIVNKRADAVWKPIETMILTATNQRANSVNQLMFDKLRGNGCIVRATRSGQWEPRLEPAPAILTVKNGMRLMLVANDPNGMYANGTMGTLLDYDPTHRIAQIRLDEPDQPIVEVGERTWEITVPRIVHDPEDPHGKGRLETVVIGSYRQLPFKPGWAVTIHKSQGQTFDRVHIEFGARPLFAPGQAYVALSRATSLQGLTLDRPLTVRDVKADQNALAFTRLMRNETNQPTPMQNTLF